MTRISNPTLGLLAVLLAGAQPTSAPAATLRVPSDYTTIIAGLDASSPGDTVLVAPGTYTYTEVRTIPWGSGSFGVTSMAFLKDGVALLSEAGPAATLLDMSDVSHVEGSPVTIIGSTAWTEDSFVEGFALRGDPGRTGWGIAVAQGNSFTVRNCVIEDYSAIPFGSTAIDVGTSQLVVEDSVVRDCLGRSGGGLILDNQDLVVRRSRFEGCRAEGGAGGAIRINGYAGSWGYSVLIEDTVFQGNRSYFGGGAFVFGSQAAYESFEFRNCAFIDNESEVSSGGALVVSASATTVRIEGCLFAMNRSDMGGGNRGGGTPSSRHL